MATLTRRSRLVTPPPPPPPAAPAVSPVESVGTKESTEDKAEAIERFQTQRSQREALETIQRYKSKVRNPLTAIRAKCVECSGGSLKEVAECQVKTCALIPFRMGINPFNKKTRERMERDAESDDE